MNDSSSAIALSKNFGSPKGIAIAPTTLIPTSTMTMEVYGIAILIAKISIKVCVTRFYSICSLAYILKNYVVLDLIVIEIIINNNNLIIILLEPDTTRKIE